MDGWYLDWGSDDFYDMIPLHSANLCRGKELLGLKEIYVDSLRERESEAL